MKIYHLATLMHSHYFQNKNPNLDKIAYFNSKTPNMDKIWSALEWKMLLYFITVWNIFQSFGKICNCLVYFSVLWFIFPILVCLDQEKSGNPFRQLPPELVTVR
jgi:hypothetical protein